MFNKILELKSKYNYFPTNIIDIGAHKGTWTQQMLQIYPKSNYFLFEANNHNELNIFNKYNNIKIFKNVILNESKQEVEWFSNNNTGDSIFKETTGFFKNTKAIKRQSIDMNTYIKDNNILTKAKNIFLKIDCQGAEIPILKGATNLYNNTDFIVLEIPLFGKYNINVPDFSSHINFMKKNGFIVFDKLENHMFLNFNIQVDILFINVKSKIYNLFMNNSLIHSIMLSKFNRNHVINYVNNKKKNNKKYTVIDIGGSANYTSWSYKIIDYIVDINEPQKNDRNIKYFKLNVNFESQWKVLFDFVKKNGKFDFCICSHIIEDISLPQVLLNNIHMIAKEGFIGIPSKYRELSRFNKFLGYIHHRWIFSFSNKKLIGYPKVNFIDYDPKLISVGNMNNELMDLSFFWKNKINYGIMNNNYLGPSDEAVIKYYNKLVNDDIDNIKNNKYYHIYELQNINKINGNFINVIVLIENITITLQFMKKLNFIPFNINDTFSVGTLDLYITFININHEYNNIITTKLKELK